MCPEEPFVMKIDEKQGFLGIKTAMDIHVSPKLGGVKLGGAFRRPLPHADEFVSKVMAEDLLEVFAKEDSM